MGEYYMQQVDRYILIKNGRWRGYSGYILGFKDHDIAIVNIDYQNPKEEIRFDDTIEIGEKIYNKIRLDIKKDANGILQHRKIYSYSFLVESL